jgi:membrane protease YdiL (CAAX protease family)
VTSAEFQILETVFLIVVASLLLLALPGYAWLRLSTQKSNMDQGDDTSPSVIQPFDLIIVGFYILVFTGFLKSAESKIENLEELQMTAGLVLVSSIAMLSIGGIIPLILFWRTNLIEFFGLRWLRWQNIFWIMPAFVFAMMIIGAILVACGWQTWVQDSLGAKPQEAVTLVRETSDVGLLVAMAVTAIIFAPITEELIFRGYLYPVVKRFTDRWFASIFSGVLFGVIHFNVMALPMLALMGVILAVIYERSGSLWVPIGCHAAFNATSVGLMLISRVYEFPTSP